MAMFAMIAGATYLGSGFFTPMYHIASSLLNPQPMMQSMQAASQGNDFFFQGGTGVSGLLIHMMVGAAFGVIFALLARALHLRGGAAMVAGIVYGLAVMVIMSFVVLPVVASLFGGGKPIADMPVMVGWATFSIEHALFGAVLGLWFVRGEQGILASSSPGVRATTA
jgi:uncharacterized membrane protein YagU involved in acid resistance